MGPKLLKTMETPLRIPVGAPGRNIKKIYFQYNIEKFVNRISIYSLNTVKVLCEINVFECDAQQFVVSH